MVQFDLSRFNHRTLVAYVLSQNNV